MATTSRYRPPIMEMQEFDESDNLLVYGESGVGKTVFGGSGGPETLLVRIEKGTVSAKRFGSQAQVVNCDTWTDIEKLQRWLRDGGYKEFRWIVWDSLHVMQEKMWRHIMDRVLAENDKRDPDIPAIQDHFKMQLMWRRFMTVICDLPTGCLFLAQPMNIETADGDEIVVPFVDGKKGALARFTVGLMSAYGRMHIVQTKSGRELRRITWQPDGPYTGKDRYNVLAPHTDGKTLADITEMIEASADKRRPTTTRRARVASRRRTA